MATVPQTRHELLDHLLEQLQFLLLSSEAFDRGFEAESKRIASTLRLLLHDTQQSRSLLGQLELKSVKFCDSSYPRKPAAVTTYCGLTTLVMSPSAGKHMPMLDDTMDGWFKAASFDRWWGAPVLIDKTGTEFGRKDLVLGIANQDGGVHVDPKLDERYARLSRQNSLAWQYVQSDTKTVPMAGVELAAVRQIAHEVLRTFLPGYAKKPNYPPNSVICGDVALYAVDPHTGRNDPCPCGSGKKFKRCCGPQLVKER